MTNLQTLHMEDVPVEDYTPLSGLSKLTTLYIASPESLDTDLSPLAAIYGNLTDKNFGMD